MKIKVYIVTYKKNDILNQNLRSLWENTKKPLNIEVTVLANHPDVVIDEENKRHNLRVVVNTTRMPHAWGYLSRDWNYCILDGFKTWRNPENVDWVVMAQNDVTWVKDWDLWLASNTKYDFISQPRGDQSMAINIEAVKKVGFFDERLTTLHFHEIDYFIMCILKLKDRASINDDHGAHNLSNCSVGNVITNTTHFGTQQDATLHNSQNWEESKEFISSKWGTDILTIDKKYVLEHFDELMKKDIEINWYPFFWDGYNTGELNFNPEGLTIVQVPKIPFILRFITCFIPSKHLRKKIRGQK